jgi:hypothetical protein
MPLLTPSRALIWPTIMALALTVGPASADLNPGDTFQNPELVTLPPHYTSGLPAWYVGAPVASLTGEMQPPTLGIPFTGEVVSEVFFVNGLDASGGLGFAYQFKLRADFTADGMEAASMAPNGWGMFNIFDTGADGSGVSTPVPPGGMPPPGFENWADGDPYSIQRDALTGAPEIRWTGALGGTELRGGQRSSIIWFETDAPEWTTSVVTLLDGGVGGSALILAPIPEPTATVLGFVGLAAVALLKRRFA